MTNMQLLAVTTAEYPCRKDKVQAVLIYRCELIGDTVTLCEQIGDIDVCEGTSYAVVQSTIDDASVLTGGKELAIIDGLIDPSVEQLILKNFSLIWGKMTGTHVDRVIDERRP